MHPPQCPLHFHLPLYLLLALLSLSTLPLFTFAFPRIEEVPEQLSPTGMAPTNNLIANSITSNTSTSSSPPVEECFYRSREACPPPEDVNRCKMNYTGAVVCCDVDRDSLIEGFKGVGVGFKSITSLHIINATLAEINDTLMTKFRWLRSLAITDGSIRRVDAEFKRNTPIVCLNMSNNALEKMERRLLVTVRTLKKLVLSHNNLTDLPNFHRDVNITLDISNNNKTSCQSLLNAKNSSMIIDFENVNHTFCTISKSFQWFNSTELLPLKQVDEFFNARKTCWPNCTCEYYRTDYVQGKLPTIAFKVDCAGKQLTEMPGELPKNTIVLNISNNNINVLKMDNECFDHIRELYADNNEIKSILSLEGTKFFDNFVMLSLRNNTLKTIPMYILSHVLDRNQNSRQVYFGENRLRCDCNTAKNLRVSLLTKQKYIPDYDEIYCENSPLKVIHLTPATMCQDNHQSWTDYIYYIISMEVFLLVCLILKVSYDYWVFKTAGYLPWPANKMPKLPCDWLCE